MSVRQPLGVCALITPWNFPMAIPAWKIMAALIAGNTIVIKPATDTPASVVDSSQVLDEAGPARGRLQRRDRRRRARSATPLVSHPT